MLDRSTMSINDAVLVALQTIAVAVAVVLVVGLPWLAHAEVVPLTLVTALVLVVPIRRDRRRRAVDLAEPFTLVVVVMAFWHFVVGSAAYGLGLQDEFFYLARLRDRAGVTIVVTQVFVLVAVVSLRLAARSALVDRAASRLAPWVPAGPRRSRDLQVLTWTMLGVGVGASVVGRLDGSIGYVAASTGTVGAITGFGAMVAAASPIAFVEARSVGASQRASIAMAAGIGIAAVVQSLVAGNRGTALSFFVAALIAASRSGRRYPTRRLVAGAAALFFVLATAVAYGSAYRDAATRADGSVSSDLLGTAGDAFGDLIDQGPGVFDFVADRAIERLDSTISLGVVVAQYDELGAAERDADLDNDIVRTGLGGLAPRVLWADKPTADPQALGEVYFGFPNAYATTPIATLLRNFGPLSVALGMAVVGFVLGVAHRVLASTETWTGARAVVYLLVATRAMNLEGSLATFLPDASRLLVVSIATFGLAWGVSRLLDVVRGVESVPLGVTRGPRALSPAYSFGQLAVWLVALTCVARIASVLV